MKSTGNGNIEEMSEKVFINVTCLNKTANLSKLCNDSGNNFLSPTPSSDDENLSTDALIGLIFLYSITTFLSLAGNVLVVLVFVKGRRSRTDLRLFLINLAASDLIMAAFCMPFTFADSIMGYWVFTAPLCPIVLFFQIFSVCGSVFTNVAIGIDRFMAVSFPLHSRITYRRGKYVIALVWVCSFALSAVQLFIGRSSIYNGKVICNEDWPHPESRPLYTVFVMILTYMFPLVILLLTYSVVGIMLWKRTAPGNKHYERDRHQLRSKIKVFLNTICISISVASYKKYIAIYCLIFYTLPQTDKRPLITTKTTSLFLKINGLQSCTKKCQMYHVPVFSDIVPLLFCIPWTQIMVILH